MEGTPAGHRPAGSPVPLHPLGEEASRRFQFRSWARPRHRAGGHAPRIGFLASQTSRFVSVVGRSLASRRMIGERAGLTAGQAAFLPVRPPDQYLPLAAERSHRAISVSDAERRTQQFWQVQQRMTGMAAPARKLPPLGLPRATARSDQSRVGRQTGPAGASKRMASQPAFVSNPREVAGTGRLVSSRDRLTIEARAPGRPPPAAWIAARFPGSYALQMPRYGAAQHHRPAAAALAPAVTHRGAGGFSANPATLQRLASTVAAPALPGPWATSSVVKPGLAPAWALGLHTCRDRVARPPVGSEGSASPGIVEDL